MKKWLIVMLIVAIVGSWATTASAAQHNWDDMSWWAQSGATPAPVKDSEYSGYWWWPTSPAAGSDDVWGNRGVVYNMYSPAPPPPPPAPPRPPAPKPPDTPVAPPVVERTIPVFNHVLFDFDKSTVKPAGETTVKNVANELKAHPKDTITIEGHTDNVNRSGDPTYNTKLGQRRADAVQKVMVNNGVSAGRISAVSKGDGSPAVSNDTAENRNKNRRVVFIYKIND
jgi:outer membrane protein OmpA-like peptidoglycan-associated protein